MTDLAMSMDPLLEHDPLQLGPYKLLARLGCGGMGTVYLGESRKGEAAALKVVRPELARDPEFRARFAREVEAGRRVASPYVARFLDADLAGKAPWLATEYVAGPTLHRQVELEGPLAGDRLLAVAAGLADALVAVHRAGLVHRDLKPNNVILENGAPRLIDFGVAWAEGSAGLTSTGALVGSPAYMSPEQAEGRRDVGPAADVFSWASCVVYAARGEPPFGRGEAAGMLYKVVHQQPDLCGVPDELLAVVEACLHKDPGRRPSAAHVLEACTRLAGGEPAPAPRDTGAIDRTMVSARDLRAALPPRPSVVPERRHRSRRGRLVAALSVLLLGALVAGALALRPERDRTAVLAASPAASGDGNTTTTAGAAGGAPDAAPAADPAAAPGAAPPPPEAGAAPVEAGPATTPAPSPGPASGPAPQAPPSGGAPVTPPAGAPTPSTVVRPPQLIVDDASDTPTGRASGPGWKDSIYAPGFYGVRYWTTKAQKDAAAELPFTFSFFVRDGEQLQRTVEAWWTVGRPNEASDRNRAVPFILRNGQGVEVGRVGVDQRVGHATWNRVGRFTFSPGWNTVVISRVADPALGQDIVADAVRISP